MLFIVLTFNLMPGLQLTDCFEWVCESCLRKASSYILCGDGIWSWLKGILTSTGKLVGVDKLKNFGNLHIMIQFLLKNSHVLWFFISFYLHRKRGERGIINTEHMSKRCKNLMFLWHESQTLQQVPLTFSGSVILPAHSTAPTYATTGCSCKACLQRRTANPHTPVACNNFWSGFFLAFYSGSFCRSLQLLWGYKVEGLGAHGFPVSLTIGSLRLCEVAQALFYAQSVFVRLVLNNEVKKSNFLSQLLLQMRLKSLCLLGRGVLCTKLCGCRL